MSSSLFDLTDDLLGIANSSSDNSNESTYSLMDETLQALYSIPVQTTLQKSVPTSVDTRVENNYRLDLSSVHNTPPDEIAKQTMQAFDTELKEYIKSNTMDTHFQHNMKQKYLVDILDQQPSSPFVQVIKKRILKKLQDVIVSKQDVIKSKQDDTIVSKQDDKIISKEPNMKYPKNQQERRILDKLLQLSPSDISKLPKSQQDLIQHTKNYRHMLSMKLVDIQKLPIHQQQLVHHIRSKANLPDLRQTLLK